MLLNYIKKMFKYAFEKEYYDTYWAFDLHKTIIKPTYDLNNLSIQYYPWAKECMQLISWRDDITTIVWSSSYPNEIEEYLRQFEKDEIRFDHVGNNPGISSNSGNFGYYETKFYFNVLFEDKAGFDPETEWKEIYDYLMECQESGYLPNPRWTTKY
jgi:hypothetical protein